MMRLLMKLFSGGRSYPQAQRAPPKDCDPALHLRQGTGQGPAPPFIHHPADQTLAHRSGSASRGSEHPAGDPTPRLRVLSPSPGPSCPSPVPSSPCQPGASGGQSPRASSTNDPQSASSSCGQSHCGDGVRAYPRQQATPTDQTIRRRGGKAGSPGPESHPGRNPCGTGARPGNGSGPTTASDPVPHRRGGAPHPRPGLWGPCGCSRPTCRSSRDHGDPAHLQFPPAPRTLPSPGLLPVRPPQGQHRAVLSLRPTRDAPPTWAVPPTCGLSSSSEALPACKTPPICDAHRTPQPCGLP